MCKNYIIILILTLTGCVSSDPSQGGFLGGVIGIASGQYDQDIENKESLKNKKEESLIKPYKENEIKSSERKSLDKIHQDLQNKSASINRENRKLQDQINTNRNNIHHLNQRKYFTKTSNSTSNNPAIKNTTSKINQEILNKQNILKKQNSIIQKLGTKK